jgi:hypothetical protein
MDTNLSDRLAIQELVEVEVELMIGFMLQLAEADEEVSEEESAHLKAVSAELGRDAFMARATAARTRFATMEDVFAAAEGVVRPQAQRAIFQCVRDLALGDGIVAEEYAYLERLAKLWHISWSY